MDLLLNLGHVLAGAGENAAEIPEHAPLLDSIDRDNSRERSKRQVQYSRGWRMPHGELRAIARLAAIASAAFEGHGEDLIFF